MNGLPCQKAVQYAKAATASAMPLPKQPGRQSHGASPAHTVPCCLQTSTHSSSGSEPCLQALLPGQLSLYGWRCLPTQRCLLSWKAKRSLEQKERESNKGLTDLRANVKRIGWWCWGRWKLRMMIAEARRLEKLRTGNRSGCANNRLNVTDFKWRFKHSLIKD